MSYILEPNPVLLSPVYWDGADINAPNHLGATPESEGQVSEFEGRIAASLLKRTLGFVVADKYEELQNPIQIPEFNPDSGILEDGTILVIDRESLARYSYPATGERVWDAKKVGEGGSPILPPYGKHWKENQIRSSEGERPDFGDDRAFFPELFTIYNRYLQWGVLLSRRNKLRLIATWALSDPQARRFGIKVKPPKDDGQILPFNVGPGTANLGPDVQADDFTLRLITRVRDVTVIKTDYKHEPSQKSRGWRERVAAKLADLNVAINPPHQPAPIPVRG